MSTPAVSIVMPTFNRLSLLPRAIASIQAQTLADWELLVINDASSDGSREYLDELAGQDPRIRAIHNPSNRYPDISATLNQGLHNARADLVARLDDDDRWCHPDKLRRQAEFLLRHPDYAVVGGAAVYVDANGRERARKFSGPKDDGVLRAHALITNPFNHSAVMFRRAWALQSGGYGAFSNSEDWDLWLKLGRFGKFSSLADLVVECSLGSRKTTIYRRAQTREAVRIVLRHRRDYPRPVLALLMHAGTCGQTYLPGFAVKPVGAILRRAKRWTVPDAT